VPQRRPGEGLCDDSGDQSRLDYEEDRAGNPKRGVENEQAPGRAGPGKKSLIEQAHRAQPGPGCVADCAGTGAESSEPVILARKT